MKRKRRENLECYQYKHCTDRWLTQIDLCTSGWTRNIDGELVPLWYNGQQFPDELLKPVKSKVSMIQNPVCNEETPPPPPPPPPKASRLQRFSALVAKNTLQVGIELDDGCFAGNEEDESDTDTSDNDNNSGDSDNEVYT